MRHALALALLLLAAPASATTVVIDFEAEAIGDHGNSFEAAPGVTLTGWRDRDLFVREFRGSQALEVGEEGGSLELVFTIPVLALSLDFGGDSPAAEIRAEPALLIGFDASGAVVGFDTLAPNRNSLVDQTLRISGGVYIASAFFAFAQLGEFEPASPIVDRIVLTTVPEPGTIGLAALALLAHFVTRRRHSAD